MNRGGRQKGKKNTNEKHEVERRVWGRKQHESQTCVSVTEWTEIFGKTKRLERGGRRRENMFENIRVSVLLLVGFPLKYNSRK